MTTKNDLVSVLDDHELYLGDNGRCFCGAHAGMSARYSGRDLSGQPVMKITFADRVEAKRLGWTPQCETCYAIARAKK